MIPRPEDIEACWPNSNEIACIYTIGADMERGKPSFYLGGNGITRIEKTVKPGEHSWLPYVRLWIGDAVFAEFCQHQLAGVIFKVSA